MRIKTVNAAFVACDDTVNFLKQAGLKHFTSYIKRYKMHADAPVEGKVATQYGGDKISKAAAEDYTNLALELNSLWANQGAGQASVTMRAVN